MKSMHFWLALALAMFCVATDNKTGATIYIAASIIISCIVSERRRA